MSDTCSLFPPFGDPLAFLPVILLTVKAMVFPVAMYGCESSFKKDECWRIDVFELRYWRILLTVLWTVRWPNLSILKEINPEYSLEGLMLKVHYLDTWFKSWLTGKDPDASKDWRQEEKQMTEDEIVGWYHQFNGHEFEQTLGDCEGQEILVCRSS